MQHESREKAELNAGRQRSAIPHISLSSCVVLQERTSRPFHFLTYPISFLILRSTRPRPTMPRNQAQDAQDLYDSRSQKYDDSHHPRLARHMVELARLQPGEQVLDLACGTGLVTFPASQAVGSSGCVVGVDISSGMLDIARQKLASSELHNVDLHLHSISDLNALDSLRERQFDVIICCSALVLLEDAAAALKHWTAFLKVGGRMIVDVTHPMNLAAGTAFERIGLRLGKPVPYYRQPFREPADLVSRMEQAGLSEVMTIFLSVMDIPGTDKLEDYVVPRIDQPRIEKVYDVADADALFDKMVEGTAYVHMAQPSGVRQEAKRLFQEEWAKLADDDGKVREVDGIFVGIGINT